eukprot:g5926.t1
MSEDSTPVQLDVIVRSQEPTKYKDLHFCVSVTCTVSSLKTLISERHPRRPSIDEQVLICNGRVLKNNETPFQETLNRSGEGPINLHLVLKLKESPSSSSSNPLNQAPQQSSTANSPPVVAVPYMMMNPVVSAAYNAAIAAVYQNPESARGGSMQLPGGGFPVLSPAPIPSTGSPSSSNSTAGPSTGSQTTQNQMVPAIAFFPLGIPVLVPAAAAMQNQGFQIGQTAPVQTPPMQEGQGQVQRRQVQPPVRRHGPEPGPVRVRRRRVVVYRISIRSMLQLVIVVTFLFFSFSREKFVLCLVAMLVVYLLAKPMRRLLHQLHQRDGNGQRRRRGIWNELLAFILSFISSVFPHLDVNLMNFDGNPDSPRNRAQEEEEPHLHLE